MPDVDDDNLRDHEAEIASIMAPALAALPAVDPCGGLTRDEAANPGHAANRLLRAVAAMIMDAIVEDACKQ